MIKSLTILLVLLLTAGAAGGGETSPAGSPRAIKLPRVIGDNMVLQRGKPVPIWGWAGGGEEVRVSLGKHRASTKANERGEWLVRLPAMKAGGPFKMTVAAGNTIEIKNILVGEVWLCSGQSNMKWLLDWSKDGKQEAAAAKHPRMRFFTVPVRASGMPKHDIHCPAAWKECRPRTAKGFSAVGYFFGLALQRELKVPVGLINSSVNNTCIEPWTSAAGFKLSPRLEAVSKRIADADLEYRRALKKDLPRIDKWTGAALRAVAEGKPLPPPPDKKWSKFPQLHYPRNEQLRALRYMKAWNAAAGAALASGKQLPVAPSPNWPPHPLLPAGYPKGPPTVLYNQMLHPLVPFAIRGAIWYQGEANNGRRDGSIYTEKMKALIGGWRAAWKQGEFPFYFVQLAPYRTGSPNLPAFWEAQCASLAIPKTGMAVISDVTEKTQPLHPKDKRPVGERLALWALARTYGRMELVCSGPMYKSMTVKGATIRISFDHVGSGLASRDGKPLTWFQVAGKDRKFVSARAKIDGNTVVVSSPTTTRPVAVRFGWDKGAQPNFMNREKLPAVPFRTDKW